MWDMNIGKGKRFSLCPAAIYAKCIVAYKSEIEKYIYHIIHVQRDRNGSLPLVL